MRSELFLVMAVLAGAVAGCATADMDDSPTPTEATFQAVVDQVLTPKCTFAQCHSSTTVAAGLDLTPERACDTLINQPSCLFPDRMRVVPGSPDASFFFHKVAGQGLDQLPTGDCGFGSATPTNALMPFGAAELDADELQIVHGWIAGGAQCDGDPTPMTGIQVESITSSHPAPLAGETITITVTLDQEAPTGGQIVTIDADRTALSAPVKMVVAEGTKAVQFDAFAMRPTSRFAMTVRTGESAKEVVLRVAGIEIAEVMANPIGPDEGMQWIKIRNRTTVPLDLSGYQLKVGESTYNLVAVPLVGTLPAGGCAVIGGPTTSIENGYPEFTQVVNFSPNLPHSYPQAAGFALFDRTAVPLGGVLAPVDTMLVGTNNNAGLVGPDASAPSPYCATPTPGMSALRTGPTTCGQAQMQPNSCE